MPSARPSTKSSLRRTDTMTEVYTKPSVRSAWGDTASGSDLTDPGDAAVAAAFVPAGTKPVRQTMNFILRLVSAGMRYFMQRGIVDYDAAEIYTVGSAVR